jgi:hypothetical protein
MKKNHERVHAYMPQQIAERKASKSLQEERQEMAPKFKKRKTGKNSNKP